MESDVNALKKQFEDFLSLTDGARALSERDRDYRDHKQWTHEEQQILRARGQAPVVINRIAPKVDFLMGLERQQRTDPKAFPRTRDHEKAAEAATDALRYVAENNQFDQTASESWEELLVEGYEAAIIEPERVNDQVEVRINRIPWDRFYYDPHSRDRYFQDARFMGLVIWMDLDEAKEKFPDAGDALESSVTADGEATFEDRPKWADTKRKRIRVCQHYYKEGGKWMLAIFSGENALVGPKESPLKDEFGRPACPIEAAHAYIDRDNNRYGMVRGLIDPQNEINHRRSKALFLMSSRQIAMEEGAIAEGDENTIRTEMRKANGLIKLAPGALKDGRFQINPTNDMADAQFTLLSEAKAEIDAVGANASMDGSDPNNQSGRALQARQQGGQIELGPLLDTHRTWKQRVYRQAWSRIKQFWDEERWVRVTDDEDNLKWVGLNRRMTVGELLHEKAQEGDQRAQQMLQQLVQRQDPRLNQPAPVQNNVAELDVDIMVEDGPDVVTIQQEQFEVVADLYRANPQAIPFEAVLELSSLRNKDKVLERMKGDPQVQQMQSQIQQMQTQMGLQRQQLELRQLAGEIDAEEAETEKTRMETMREQVEAIQRQLENSLVRNFPDLRPQVTI